MTYQEYKANKRERNELILWIAGTLIMTFLLTFFISYSFFTEVGLAETYICSTQKGTWVNVRSAPSAEAAKIGKLRYGYNIEAEPVSGGYLKFSTEEWPEAYVKAEYFETTDGGKYSVTDRVNKRSRPNGKKLGYLKKGSWVTVLAWTTDPSGRKWARCYGNVYILGDYLSRR